MDRQDLIVEIIKETREDVKVIQSDMSDMKVDVALNKDDLKKHMERSDHLENIVEKLADLIRLKEQEIDVKIDLITKKLSVGHIAKVIVAVASGVGTISGAVYAIMKFIP